MQQGNITLSPTITVTDFFASIKDAVRQVMAEKPNTDDALMSSDEVMKLCKISHATLQNWRNANKIPFNKIGNKIFYRKLEVLEAIRQVA
jgi:predicted DNA-binding transcriptional regulator AlpA